MEKHVYISGAITSSIHIVYVYISGAITSSIHIVYVISGNSRIMWEHMSILVVL